MPHFPGLKPVGKGDGSDLSLTVSMGRADAIFQSSADSSPGWHYDPTEDVLSVKLEKCPKVVNDVRVKFNSSSGRVPKGYEKCAFYFW